MGTANNLFDMSPEQANNLTNFGFATMAAGAQPGATTLGAIGQGGLGMNQAAAQRAQTQYLGAETQGKQFQNQLFPYQLQRMKLESQILQNSLDDGSQSISPSGASAGMPTSPSAGISPMMPKTSERPVNNPGNLRPIGASTGFQQFQTIEDGSNGMTGDLVTKISGKSPAMMAKFGNNYQPTLANLLSTYAPSGDNNDPLAYTKFVSEKTGIPPRKVITVADIPKIQDAMTQFEGNGTQRNVVQDNISQPSSDGRNAGQGLLGNIQTTPAEQPDASQVQYNRLNKNAQGLALINPEAAKVALEQAKQTPYFQTLQEDIKGTQQRKMKAYEQDLTTDKTWSDSIPGLQESEQRLKTMTQAFKLTETGAYASNKAELLAALKGIGINIPKEKQDSISNIQLGLHEQGIDVLQELKQIVQGAGGRILNSEFQNMKQFFTGPNIQPGANQQMLSEALGINHAHQKFVGDWTKAGGMNNALNNGKPMRTTDFQSNWYQNNKIADFVEQAKKDIGPLAGMTGNAAGNSGATHVWTPESGIIPAGGQ